jgi:hypothetical protein
VSDPFPWYDAWWLTRYVRAKAYMARRSASRLDTFLRALDPLKTGKDFELKIPQRLFSKAQFDLIRKAAKAIKPDELERHELLRHGRYVIHDNPLLVDLHAAIAPAVGELVGEEVEPAYSFIALYNKNGKCPIHLDAPVSKWTLDFCIEQSAPWPISFSEVISWPENFDAGHGDWEERIKKASGHRFTSIAMEPGQAVIFSGSSQWHFRDRISDSGPRSHCDLLFMHFIPAGMQEVSDWKNWEGLFSVPGLTEAIR